MDANGRPPTPPDVADWPEALADIVFGTGWHTPCMVNERATADMVGKVENKDTRCVAHPIGCALGLAHEGCVEATGNSINDYCGKKYSPCVYPHGRSQAHEADRKDGCLQDDYWRIISFTVLHHTSHYLRRITYHHVHRIT